MERFSFIFSILVVWTSGAFARDLNVSINQDVFVCGQTVRALPLAEYEWLNNQKLSLPGNFRNLLDGVTWVQQSLSSLSPSRAKMLYEISHDQRQRFSFQRNIQIQRFSPPSQLILPQGCRIEPLSVFTLSTVPKKTFAAIISYDLFEKMSLEDQTIAIWSLALDIEQASFVFDYVRNSVAEEFKFDQLRSRQFIQCWLNDQCRPRTVSAFHQFTKNLNLSYFEQDHILTPKAYAVFGANGLIKKSRRIAHLLARDFEDVFRSEVPFPNGFLPVAWEYNDVVGALALYNDDGRTRCAALYRAPSTAGIFQGYWETADAAKSYPFQYPICWNEKYQPIQGYFPVSWNSPLRLIINGQNMEISRDKLSGGNDQGTIVILNPDLSVKWLNNVKGRQMIGEKSVAIDGYLKLRADQTVECAEIGEDTEFRTVQGTRFPYRVQNRNNDFLICFDRQGLVARSIAYYEFVQFFQADLITVGNQ